MFKVTDEFKELYLSDDRDVEIWVDFGDDGDDFMSDNIVADSFKMSQDIGDIDNFSLGVANASSIELEIGIDKPYYQYLNHTKDNMVGRQIKPYIVQKCLDDNGQPIEVTPQNKSEIAEITSRLEMPVVICDYGLIELSKSASTYYADTRDLQPKNLPTPIVDVNTLGEGTYHIRRIVPYRNNSGAITFSEFYGATGGVATIYICEAIPMGVYKIDEAPLTTNSRTRKIVAYDKLYSSKLDTEVTYSEGTTLAIGDLVQLATNATGFSFGDTALEVFDKEYRYEDYENADTEEFTFKVNEYNAESRVLLKKRKLVCKDCNPSNKHTVEWKKGQAVSAIKRLKDALGITNLLNINADYFTALYNESTMSQLESNAEKYLNAMPVWREDGTADIWQLYSANTNGRTITSYPGWWMYWGSRELKFEVKGDIPVSAITDATAYRLLTDVARPRELRLMGYFMHQCSDGIGGSFNAPYFSIEDYSEKIEAVELNKRATVSALIGSPVIRIVGQCYVVADGTVSYEFELDASTLRSTTYQLYATKAELKNYVLQTLVYAWYDAGIIKDIDDGVPEFYNYDEQESYYNVERYLSDIIDGWQSVYGEHYSNTFYINADYSTGKTTYNYWHFLFNASDEPYQLFPIGIGIYNPILLSNRYESKEILFRDYDPIEYEHVDAEWWGTDDEIQHIYEYHFKNDLFNSYIRCDTDITFSIRDVIKAVCEIQGVMWTVDRYGNFKLIRYEGEPVFPALDEYPDEDMYPSGEQFQEVYDSDVKALTVYSLASTQRYKGMRMYTPNGWLEDVTKRSSGTYYEIDNVITENFELTDEQKQTIYENIWDAIADIVFNSLEAKLQGLPWMDVGDVIGIDTGDISVDTFVVSRELSGVQSHDETVSQIY